MLILYRPLRSRVIKKKYLLDIFFYQPSLIPKGDKGAGLSRFRGKAPEGTSTPLVGVRKAKNKINGKTFNYFSSVSSFHYCENISLILGSLLGNSYMRKSKSYPGIIITFIKCSDNIEYLM